MNFNLTLFQINLNSYVFLLVAWNQILKVLRRLGCSSWFTGKLKAGEKARFKLSHQTLVGMRMTSKINKLYGILSQSWLLMNIWMNLARSRRQCKNKSLILLWKTSQNDPKHAKNHEKCQICKNHENHEKHAEWDLCICEKRGKNKLSISKN